MEERTDTNGDGTAEESKGYVIGLQVIAQGGGGQVYYLMVDGHGSTRMLVDGAGQTVTSEGKAQVYDYDAYGKLLDTSLVPLTNWLFGGDGIYDPASGWTYHLARWRDGHRFVSYDSFEADPSSPANLHKYLYANACPVIGVDPAGTESLVSALITTSIQSVLSALQGLVGSAVFQTARAIESGQSADQAFVNFLLEDIVGQIPYADIAMAGVGQAVSVLEDLFGSDIWVYYTGNAPDGTRELGGGSPEDDLYDAALYGGVSLSAAASAYSAATKPSAAYSCIAKASKRLNVLRSIPNALDLVRSSKRAIEKGVSEAKTAGMSVATPDKAREFGTKAHKEAADYVRSLGNADFHAEVSYKKGTMGDTSTGSVRLDAVLGPKDKPWAVVDYKPKGSRGITKSREEQIRKALPKSCFDVPIIVVFYDPK